MNTRHRTLFLTATGAALFLAIILQSACRTVQTQAAIINNFGNQMFDIIKNGTKDNYGDLGFKTNDVAVNWKTRKEIPDQGLSNDDKENAEKLRFTLPSSFEKAIAQVAEVAGPRKDFQLEKLNFLIANSYWEQRLQVLKFDVVLTIKGKAGTVLVEQRNCALYQRGVAVGTPLQVVQSMPSEY